ncbi:MAG TPA: LPXTG cell wall anchor domain-containing protein, partial [Corynebacterium pollutisoli]|nr:LPXTG cell wall anchor domain-containing protein [Corynebacterium pollutisoli]
GSSVVGGAFLGLSALAGLAFLSSQGGGSSASSDADAPAPSTAPAAPVAPEPVAEQKALANTGVEGTLGALAIGLVAVAAGVLLILRRRSF